MKIIYFGCDISLGVFETLLDYGHQITALYTFSCPYDRVHEEKITALARSKGVEVIYDKMTETDAIELFETGNCDLFVSAEYYYKIPTPGIEKFKGLNIHYSLLPEGKGFFPVEMGKYLEIPYGGVTYHKLTSNYDEGEILIQKKFDIDLQGNLKDIYRQYKQVSVRLAKEIFINDETFYSYWNNVKPQKGKSTLRHPTKEERMIKPDMTVGQAVHLFSCFDRFTFVKSEYCPKNTGMCRVLEISVNPDTTGKYIPYKLKDGILWMALEL